MQVSNNFLEHEICTCNLPSTSIKKKKEGVQGNIESKYHTIFAALRPLRWFINREVLYSYKPYWKTTIIVLSWVRDKLI